MAWDLAHHSQEARVTDAAQRDLLLDHGEPRSRLVHQSIMARRVNGGYGEYGDAHKRRNGVNGDETEKTGSVRGVRTGARRAAASRAVRVDERDGGRKPSQIIRRLAPAVTLVHSTALRAVAASESETDRDHSHSSPFCAPFTPFLRL